MYSEYMIKTDDKNSKEKRTQDNAKNNNNSKKVTEHKKLNIKETK